MARKKELMELENTSMEENTPLDGTDTEAGTSSLKETAYRPKQAGMAWT